MNWDIIQGNWDQFKGVMRQKWGNLTDQDFEYLKGKKEQFVGALQERLGVNKDQVKKDFDEISDSFIRKIRKPEEVTH